MYNNFEILEAKCKKYYMRKMLKIALPVGFIFLVIVASILDLFLSTKEKKDKVVVKHTQKEIEIIDELPKKEKVKIIVKQEKKVIKDVQYDLHLYSSDLLKKSKNHPVKKHSVKQKQAVKKIQKTEPKQEKFSLSLKRVNSVNDMIKIYNKEKRYSLALKIAKHFYKQKNYKKSLKWSKKANTLNPKASEAWLIYAKSEYEQGNKVRAENILRVYIKNSGSKEAKELLVAWIKEDN